MKFLSIALAFILIFCITGCTLDDTPCLYPESDKCFKVFAMGYDLEANIEQSNEFRAIWNTLEWQENADCDSYNYWFKDGEVYIRYDSKDGILYDSSNNRHVILSEETNIKIKDLIEQLTFIESRPDVVIDNVLKVWATYGFTRPRPQNPNLQISQEQSESIKNIWQRCEWIDAVTETVYDYIFVDGEREVRYSYDEGIFNDVTNMKSAVLSDEMRTEVNNVIDHLIVLPIID